MEVHADSVDRKNRTADGGVKKFRGWRSTACPITLISSFNLLDACSAGEGKLTLAYVNINNLISSSRCHPRQRNDVAHTVKYLVSGQASAATSPRVIPARISPFQDDC